MSREYMLFFYLLIFLFVLRHYSQAHTVLPLSGKVLIIVKKTLRCESRSTENSDRYGSERIIMAREGNIQSSSWEL